MSPMLLVSIAVFIGFAALAGAIGLMIRGNAENDAEERLEVFTNLKTAQMGKEASQKSVLLEPLEQRDNVVVEHLLRLINIKLLISQADLNLTVAKFLAICAGFATGGAMIVILTGLHAGLLPIVAISAGILPLLWLLWMRRKRLKAFAKQLPDALELIARALRAGHSLGAGFKLVAEEMMPPIGKEFARVFEEQNFGVPFDDSLNDLSERVPNMDLRFFSTAIILQRQTGGDLAEILDKIGSLIRQRFQIWGQVQALTGEGRLSGVVLLALPPLLFLAVYTLNPDYVMVLFTDPMGKKMLAGGAFLQVVGALVIRKIINIKV